jgi:hypothetical protein
MYNVPRAPVALITLPGTSMISFTARYFHHGRNVLDDVGLYVQELGGHFETHRGHVIEFFVPVEYRDFVILKYPFLREVEYVV